MFLDNAFSSYLYAALAFTITICVSFFIKPIIVKYLKSFTERTKNTFDDVIFALIASFKLPFYFILALYIAVQFLTLHAMIRQIIDTVFIVCIVYQLITGILILLDYSLDRKVNDTNGSSIAHVKDLIQLAVKAGLWAIGLLFILSNLGINITSLVAGLGIGGIAIALAVQSILGDLFSYFAIYFDKPFIRGDFIIVGTQMGVVEKVGIKTTRIRALQGEELVIANSELTSSRIQNFKKMEERRILFTFRIAYDTPLEKLEKVPQYVQDVITTTELVRFDRAHLLAFGESSYVFEVVYFVQSGDYNQYMDIHQSIHFQMLKTFAHEHIALAYPTQAVHLASEHSTPSYAMADALRR